MSKPQPAVEQVKPMQSGDAFTLSWFYYPSLSDPPDVRPVSLMAFTFMLILAFLEFFVYRETWMHYEYEVDKDFKR